eukprot:TRINITY_DN13309_c0_g1_i1.p1 TRINITY_DN13309_c0_g1~~TRINITY_DN13309_c0_g1_i1.p1  ORF type:complete len:818 (+),score=243.85 TRINITY_DN13309_c0_g1_i1:73-2526(+)
MSMHIQIIGKDLNAVEKHQDLSTSDTSDSWVNPPKSARVEETSKDASGEFPKKTRSVKHSKENHKLHLATSPRFSILQSPLSPTRSSSPPRPEYKRNSTEKEKDKFPFSFLSDKDHKEEDKKPSNLAIPESTESNPLIRIDSSSIFPRFPTSPIPAVTIKKKSPGYSESVIAEIDGLEEQSSKREKGLRRRNSWTGWDEPHEVPYVVMKHYREDWINKNTDLAILDWKSEEKRGKEEKGKDSTAFVKIQTEGSVGELPLLSTDQVYGKNSGKLRRKSIFGAGNFFNPINLVLDSKTPAEHGNANNNKRHESSAPTISREPVMATRSSSARAESSPLVNIPPRSGIRVPVVVESRRRIGEERLMSLWQSPTLGGAKPVRLSKLKAFWKKMSQIVDVTLPLDERWFDFIFQQCDEEGLGKLRFEQFRVFVAFYCLKMKLSLLKDDVLCIAFPRNTDLMEQTLNHIELNFDLEEDRDMLNKFWRKSFPDEQDMPDIPSEKWKIIGFQNSDPQTDFRGAGRFGLECLLKLTEHKNFFSTLRHVFDLYDIPFVISSMNALGLILDFLGWGYKNPKVPYGRYINTYKLLFDLLFPYKGPPEAMEFEVTCSILHKIYFLVFGTLTEVIAENKTSYLQFPQALETTADRIEEILKKYIRDDFTINKYLVERFGFDVGEVFLENKFFYIWLTEDNYKSIPYQKDINLGDILQKLEIARGLTSSIAFYTNGHKIENTNITLQELATNVIYFLPKDSPPGIGSKPKHPCFCKKYTELSTPTLIQSPPPTEFLDPKKNTKSRERSQSVVLTSAKLQRSKKKEKTEDQVL